LLFDVELQKKNWSSACYKHFKPSVIIRDKGKIKSQFICQMCVSFFCSHWYLNSYSKNPQKFFYYSHPESEEDSTTNLLHHVKSCGGQLINESQSIACYAHGSSYSKAELQYLVSLWVFQCHWPFAIIEDIPLQWILKMLYAKVETPSEQSISWDVKEIHSISKVHVGKVLQVCLHTSLSLKCIY
jgi:hypothetical protein